MRSSLLAVALALSLVAGCVGTPGEAGTPSTEERTEALASDEPAATEATTDDERTANEETTASPTDDRDVGTLEVHFIDVGQADAALVLAPGGETMLVDSGDWRDDGGAVIEYLEARGVDRIDHLVTTHAHADHIGGHAAVIDHFEREGGGVGAVYDPGVASTSATYERYLDAIERHDVTLYEVGGGDSFDLGANATVDVYHPPAERSSDDLDDNSLVLTVEHGDATVLFSGDAGEAAERRLVDAHGENLTADVYQVGHHGSSTSSSAAFLDAVDPAVAVISSDYDSQYGHPHEEVLERLGARDVETYWTGVHGTVAVESDGETLTVATQTAATTNATELESEPESNADPADMLEERTTIRLDTTAFTIPAARCACQ